MPESAHHHCPFLNRADRRCAEHFSLDRLGHAFEFCFDAYKTCPTYLQLLVERQVKRVSAGAGVTAVATAARDAGTMKIGSGEDASRAQRNLIQITLPRRYAQSAA
jgi:hypothetical protein